MPWIAPVLDRTEEDVERGTAKGYCNAVDLNRLEGNCAALAELLGITVSTRSWARLDFPTVSDLSRIQENIAALRAAYRAYSTTPPNPENPLNTWQKWNAAEKILSDVRELYLKTLAAFPRCGEGFAGDGIGVI